MPRENIPEHARQQHHYSKDLRQRIIYLKFNLNFKNKDIACTLNMSKRVVERTLQMWRDTGEVVPLEVNLHSKRCRIMSPNEMEYLVALIERHPNLYLDEIQRHLQRQHGVVVGTSTIWNTFTELGLTHKKLSKAAAERNPDAHALYMFEIGAESPDRLVFIDESRIDCRTICRQNGWAFSGARARVSARFVRGPGYSFLPALCSDGIIFSDVHKGTYDGEHFVQYVEALMEHMNPWPASRSVLVMDNCATHHVRKVQIICEARGVRLYYLPPYSPNLNPIEEAFSYIKSVLNRNSEDFQAAVDSKRPYAVNFLIHDALATITPDKAAGWMRHSGYMSN